MYVKNLKWRLLGLPASASFSGTSSTGGPERIFIDFRLQPGSPLGSQWEPVDASWCHPILNFLRRLLEPLPEGDLDSICRDVAPFWSPFARLWQVFLSLWAPTWGSLGVPIGAC